MGYDPNQPNPQNPQGPYSGGYQQPQPTDPYSGQQYGQPQGPGGYQQQYQQPPYGQQQQQNPYGTPSTGPSSLGLEPNVAAGLSYLFWWVSGLVIYLTEKQNRFVRFHAMQAILLTAAATVLTIINAVAGAILPSVVALLVGCLVGLLGIGFFVVWIICMVNAFQGKYFKLPIIGEYAEKYSAPAGTPTGL